MLLQAHQAAGVGTGCCVVGAARVAPANLVARRPVGAVGFPVRRRSRRAAAGKAVEVEPTS